LRESKISELENLVHTKDNKFCQLELKSNE